ncbi:protein of unknown function [Paenibacillus alvei]|uniref:Uncharacterized protein n=1 Tax=Paenibacillus alvei TaxID=44250 RepID=A0A383RJL7_PAEAL|nr:protein of unknown function [Paenibacillus alvei]
MPIRHSLIVQILSWFPPSVGISHVPQEMGYIPPTCYTVLRNIYSTKYKGTHLGTLYS